MKVLQILPALELGGVERGTIDLARGLKGYGVQTVVISSGGSLVPELQREGIPHYALPVQKKSILSLSLVSRMVEIIQKERIDLVHARSRVPAWLAWLAARKAGVPFVTTCHGYYSTHLLSRVMGWGKNVIVPSQVIARHMIEDFGVPPERITVIPRGVDLTEFPYHRDKYDAPPPPVFRILNLGRFSPIKGQLEFLHAIHLVRQRKIHVEAWLAGSEGEGKSSYTEKIHHTIRQLGLEKNVKILGARRDVPELLRNADLLVLSSLIPESFGRVLIEAGATGTACVATRLGGAVEIIEEGKDGLLVPAGDEKSMADAIIRLLHHPKEAKEMARHFREKVEKNFSLTQMTEKTLQVYHQVKTQKKILVIKVGALGDVILAGPSLGMIRKKFPAAHISLLVDTRHAPVVSHCPYLNEIIPLDRAKARSWIWLIRLAKRLRREGIDLSIDFQNTKRTHFLAFLAGIPKRYGYRRGPLGWLLNHPDLNFYTVESPIKHQFRILTHLGINQLDEKLELWLDAPSETAMEVWLKENQAAPDKKIVGLALGSSSRWSTKRWPVESFRSLAQKLTQDLGCQILLIGSPGEEALSREFSVDGMKVMNGVGKTSLEELIALVKQLSVLVTGDTAPLHIASALGVPTVALFGPTDPRRHVAGGNGGIVLTKRLPCQPCYKGVCKYSEHLACLKRITVEEVFEAVRKHLSSSWRGSVEANVASAEGGGASDREAISGDEIASSPPKSCGGSPQ